MPKNEVKSFIDEFETKITQLHEKCTDEEITASAATKAEGKGKGKLKKATADINGAISSMESLKIVSEVKSSCTYVSFSKFALPLMMHTGRQEKVFSSKIFEDEKG